MKVIALKPGTTSIHLKEWTEPELKTDTDIKVKVLQVGICGTDREEASGGRADAPAGEPELIIGHEMLSQVVSVGKKVTKVHPGDYVVFTVRRGCNHCEACKANRSDMCTTGDYTERGIKGRHGFHAQYVVDDESYAVKVPASLLDIAVLTEPMSVVQKAISEAGLLQTARLPYLKNKTNWLQGKTALVAGMGPIGLLASIVLRLRGANVLGLDIVPSTSPRVKILEAIGGTYINNRDLDVESIQKKYPSLNMIVDAAGIAKLDFDLLDILAINGILVLTGVAADHRLINIDGAQLMRKLVLKNQVMLGSVNESIHHFEQGLIDLQAAKQKWPGVIQKLITQKVPVNQFEKAISHHTPDEIKVVIEWSA